MHSSAPIMKLLSTGAALRLEDLAQEGWGRFRHTSLLDDYLAVMSREVVPPVIGEPV